MYNISIRSTVILFFLLVNYSGFLLLLLTSPVPASYLPSLLSSPPFSPSAAVAVAGRTDRKVRGMQGQAELDSRVR